IKRSFSVVFSLYETHSNAPVRVEPRTGSRAVPVWKSFTVMDLQKAPGNGVYENGHSTVRIWQIGGAPERQAVERNDHSFKKNSLIIKETVLLIERFAVPMLAGPYLANPLKKPFC